VAAADDVLAFAELAPDVFRDFRVESAAEDCILFNVAVSHLSRAPRRPPPRALARRPTPVVPASRSRALAAGRDAPATTLRLAKRGAAPFVVATVARPDLVVRNDVPVRLMRAEDMRHYAPPTYPAPRVRRARAARGRDDGGRERGPAPPPT